MTFEKPIPFPPFDPNFPSRSSGTDSPTPSELRLRSASRPPGQPVEQGMEFLFLFVYIQSGIGTNF
jgi:hypothetical protein